MPWIHILNADELNQHYGRAANLDPAFVAKQRAFYEGRTVAQLNALSAQAWNCNDADGYQLARSHAALAQNGRA